MILNIFSVKNIQTKIITSIAVMVSVFIIYNLVWHNIHLRNTYELLLVTGGISYQKFGIDLEKVITVGTWEMFFSIPIIAFLVSTILKPNFRNLLLIPLLAIVWVLLSEGLVKIFHIPIIHTNPWEGGMNVTNNIFFNFTGAYIALISMVIIGIIVGAIGLALSYIIRGIFK